MTGVVGRTFLNDSMKEILSNVPAGGIMLFRYNLDVTKNEVEKFLEECVNYIEDISGIIPFIAADHEGGLVHRFGVGVERLPSALSYWNMAQRDGWETALQTLEETALRSAKEIRELGITMNFAPVVEILTEDNRSFLVTRSYGPDQEFVSNAASAFIRSMNAAGIVSVIKHFPGNTGDDPHYDASVLNAEGHELELMIEPFRVIIEENQPPALMMSHVLVPAIDPDRIASLSPLAKNILRDELGFKGIIISDDFSMEAAAREFGISEAVVKALIAGSDMVMVWPNTVRAAHRAIIQALEEERLPRERLLEAVERILTEKIRFNLINLDEEYEDEE
jgi:beta-N-acetylhexosaminidase